MGLPLPTGELRLMPINNTLQIVSIQSITVLRDSRQRRQINTEGLEQSIAQNGLINPIIVRPNSHGNTLTLVAGERRLQSCINLGWTEVPVRFTTDLSEIEAQILELEENAKREDLPWTDLVRAIHRIHTLHSTIDPTWTQSQTAEVISQSEGQVSMLLSIHPHLDTKIRTKLVSSCASARDAYNLIKTDRERQQASALGSLLEDLDTGPKPTTPPNGNNHQNGNHLAGKLGSPPPDIQPRALAPISLERQILEESVQQISFLDWAPTYTGPKFNVLHVDFPYGQTERGPQQLTNEPDIYEDSPTIYFDLLDCFCTNLDRFFSVAGWIMFWYSARFDNQTRDKLEEAGLTVQTHPLIWVHSDNVGISADHRRRPRHIYDTCLLASRGDTPIAQVVSDAHHSPTERSLHPSCKPVPMLKHFLRMFIDNHSTLFDPTCGSGSALRAAEELGAQSVLGLEINPDYRESAIKALQATRLFKSLSKSLEPTP